MVGAPEPRARAYDVVVVGAGFAGLYMLYRLRRSGYRARVFEAGGGVGGTWYWNRYPGARCDIDSLEYSYQFSEELQQEWSWTERYATQPEILRYANHVADRFDLRRDIEFGTRVESAIFDETSTRWRIVTSRGETSSSAIVFATGCLSRANEPAIPGRSSFEGPIHHTGRWPHEGVDFGGARVAVLGTGSSAIQSIPLIARAAEHLFVFQRTPNYSVPAHNQPLDPEVVAAVKADYPGFRAANKTMPAGFGARTPRNDRGALEVSDAERRAVYEERWQEGGLSFLGAFDDLLLDREANETAAEFVREKIRERVRDPKVAALLSPKTVFGCKRLCVDSDYYETFNRPDVTLVDISTSPIDEITPRGLRVGEREYVVDQIVFATGFDAMTGALLAVDVRGRGGRSLREKWAHGPRTYLGVQTAGFPNLFLITGPGSPSVLANMLPAIEQHVELVTDCLDHMRERRAAWVEPEVAAEDAWVEHVNEVAAGTVLPSCNSWYLGANIPGKPRVFMPYLGFPAYVAKCEEVVSRGWEGFAFDPPG